MTQPSKHVLGLEPGQLGAAAGPQELALQTPVQFGPEALWGRRNKLCFCSLLGCIPLRMGLLSLAVAAASCFLLKFSAGVRSFWGEMSPGSHSPAHAPPTGILGKR